MERILKRKETERGRAGVSMWRGVELCVGEMLPQFCRKLRSRLVVAVPRNVCAAVADVESFVLDG